MKKPNKTSSLLKKVLEMHKSKTEEDIAAANSNIEKINEKILDAANHNKTRLVVYLREFNATYTDSAACARPADEYYYYTNSEFSHKRITEIFKEYYKNEGFDFSFGSSHVGAFFEVSWESKIK